MSRYFEHQREVQPQDIDALEHVNNAVYLRYIEDCVRTHSEACALPLAAFRAAGTLPMVREHKLTYYAQARLGDSLIVSTEVLSLAGPKAERRGQVRRVGGGSGETELLVEAYTLWVWISAATGRPMRAPESVKTSFGF